MKTLYKEGNSGKLDVIFGGWTFLPEYVSMMDDGGDSVLMVHDYRQKDCTYIAEIVSRYGENVRVAAWSFGVFYLSALYDRIFSARPEKMLAINGTPVPVDSGYGIHPAVFEGTLRSLDARNLVKFMNRMCGSVSLRVSVVPEGLHDLQALHEELSMVPSDMETFGDICRKRGWDAAWISSDDRIFPPSSMSSFWSSVGVRTVVAEGPHFPFLNWKSFNEMFSV